MPSTLASPAIDGNRDRSPAYWPERMDRTASSRRTGRVACAGPPPRTERRQGAV